MSNLAFQTPTVTKQQPAKPGPATLQGSFVAWARFVARKDKLKIVFGSSRATDGKVMYLPSLPYDLTEDDLLMVRSDIIHESGHCVDSDFEYFQKFGVKHGPLAQSLLNSIEDVRIEIKRAEKYPGAEALIHDSNVLMMRRGNCKTGEQSAAEALTAMAYMQGCVLRGWGGEHLAAFETAKTFLQQHLGEDAKPLIDQCVQLLDAGYPALNSTLDAGRLTLQIIKLFESANEDQEQSDSDEGGQEGDDSQDPQNGAGEDSGDQPPEEDDSSSTDGGCDSDESGEEGQQGDAGSNAGDEGSDEDGSPDSDGDSSSDGSGDSGESNSPVKPGKPGSPGKQSTAAAIADMLSANPGSEEVIDHNKQVLKLADEVSKGRSHAYKNKPVVPAHSVDFSPEGKEKAAAEGVADTSVTGCGWADKDANQYRRLESGIQRKSTVFLGQLQMLLRMATKSDSEETSRGRLNARKLYRASLDDDRVFKKPTERVLPKAAVTVLTDLSRSMVPRDGRNRLDEALQVQILLSKAMELIGNPTEFAGFGGYEKNVLTFAKTFDEQPLVARHRIGGLVHAAGGGTPLAEAMIHASMRLLAREESRKVMFIITDGRPAKENDVAALMRMSRSDGIDVVTFLIGFTSEQKPSYLNGTPVVCVPNLDDLTSNALSVLKEQVLGV